MKTKIAVGALLAALLVVAVYQGNRWARSGGEIWESAETRALRQADQWPRIPQMIARQIVEKYGPPEVVSKDKMEWGAHWPWKRIVVSNTPLSPLEQAVEYRVPGNKLADLARYPHGLTVNSGAGELSARGDRESLNRLTLNLAHDIVLGKRTPEQASRFFLRTIDLAVAGKSSPYMERLLFDVPDERVDRYPAARF